MNLFNPNRRAMSLLLLSIATAPFAGPALAQDRAVIATVNYPLAYFAERLVGDTADVLFPVPAGVDPSFWRPGIVEISAMQAADVIAFNGAGFATWTTKVSLSRSRIVDTSAGFSDHYISTETITHSHGEDGAHSHTGTANYFWLDFSLAARQAETLAAGLIRRMPDAEASITLNLEALTNDLAALDASAKDLNALVAGAAAISSHPRYQYFGRAYGLDITPMEWDANEAVTEEQWKNLEAVVAETGAKLFIWEATPAPEARARIKDMGLVDIVFPPLSNRPASGDFLNGMITSVEQVKKIILE
ncbi:Periplasmic solute binding protein [Sulfitobacter noctilucae]|uniref:metal ABC transporter substrate-binding protein n=1 Tax=Sulfitobacter noctilucae TaxID=1342302 RepID=UPI00046A0D22|nr:zinc ABC transporter substrate-binding protein [Sulfitobacter noctilucae]KIN75007.1 Periplasmic solute binding protein [Sulfitobacter noctilucae]